VQKVLMTLVVALGLPLVATAAPAADGVPLAADTPDKTASGTAFTAPKSWLEAQRPPRRRSDRIPLRLVCLSRRRRGRRRTDQRR
jgi:hypothetical protein